ncbi:purple acid phosphatase family protein [Desertivirga brevis]|uniref:purple acid phosphatase family protein n=1 Tax=Desertivirga brevis TaxID=2810310 RepID=UPI001A975CBA|nr:metallophosphoesterase family protein [Pedobacter sp. SYSU D00873]
MIHKLNKIKTFFSGLILLCSSLAANGQDFKPSVFPDRLILNWSGNPETSQSITWRTDTTINIGMAQVVQEDSSPALEIKAKEYKGTTQKLSGASFESGNYHSVNIDGLEPGTLYTYRVGDGQHWSEWLQFKTASVKPEPYSFIYLGDAQNDIRSKWSRVIRRAFATRSDARFIIHSGDLINRSNNDIEWGEWHYGASFINGMIPAIPTPGNHEYTRNEKKELVLDPHWRFQYTLPLNGPEGLEESVYYTDYQNMRIISLNSQMIVLDSVSLATQARWLENVLKENKKLWTVITYHHPIYSTAKGRDNKEFREVFQPLFEKYHVDLLLQGHDHTYSRGRNLPVGVSKKVGGPVYVVSVSGPKMYKISSERWMDTSAEDTQLFQVIHIDGNDLKFEAYKASGQLFDSFSLKKSNQNEPARFTDFNPNKK